jgi:hypothetical protein
MKVHAIAQRACMTMTLAALAACGGGGSGGNPGIGDNVSTAGVSLAITQPTSVGEMETPDVSVTLAGTASSNTGIVSIEWTNDRGGHGNASGTNSWTTGSVALELGSNEISVTATDGAGATATRSIVIKRETNGTGSVTLSWQPPTTREDGTPLTNLAGYYIYNGRMSGIYDFDIKIDNPGVTTYVVENLNPGTWYFVLSSYDSDGIESDYSNEISEEVL